MVSHRGGGGVQPPLLTGLMYIIRKLLFHRVEINTPRVTQWNEPITKLATEPSELTHYKNHIRRWKKKLRKEAEESSNSLCTRK